MIIAMKQMTQVRYRDWFSRAVLWNTQCKSCWALSTAVTVGGFANAQLLCKLGQRGFKKYIQKFRNTELLCLFFLEIVILRFVSRPIWQVFDETRSSSSKNLHPWNFLKSKNIEYCPIMVNSFRKRLSIPNLEVFWKADSEKILIYIVQKGLQWRRPALCCYILFTYQLHFSFFLSLSFCPTQQCMKQQTRLEVTQL